MADEPQRAEEVMAALFAGLKRHEQMALMARLEDTGALLYRRWAETEPNLQLREQLLASAERESANARLLRQIINSEIK